MSDVFLAVTAISKSFNRRAIFSDISFELRSTQSLAVTGRNGSGKSTLLKIIAGTLSASKGKIEIREGGEPVPAIDHFNILGFVAPYLQLYDEFTALENLEIIQKIRGVRASRNELRALLDRVGLYRRGDDLLRTYSSGMKQRAKYAAAVAHRPPILVLDEPTSNLDAEGKTIIREIMEEQRRNNILIIATNEVDELTVCEKMIQLGVNPERPVGDPS